MVVLIVSVVVFEEAAELSELVDASMILEAEVTAPDMVSAVVTVVES